MKIKLSNPPKNNPMAACVDLGKCFETKELAETRLAAWREVFK